MEPLCTSAGLGLPPLTLGTPTGFRKRARLAVRGRADSPKVGIFETASHRIVHIPRCIVHDPLINEVSQSLVQAIRQTRTPPYADAPHHGLVRYIQIVVERRSRTAQIVLVGNTDRLSRLHPLAEAPQTRLGPRLHSLWLNANPERTNAILGPAWEHVTGPAAVEETIDGTRVYFPPAAFGQSELDLSERLVAQVRGWVPADRRVLELYAGTGAIGLGLVARSRRVVFNELARGGLDGLALGIAALDADERSRTEVLEGPALAAVGALGDTDVVIVDPPRKGLDPELTRALCATPPELLVYVACGLPAFLRDARQLMDSGTLKLTELAAFDLFPHTEHVELVGHFTRAR